MKLSRLVGNEGNVIMVAYGKCKCGLTPVGASWMSVTLVTYVTWCRLHVDIYSLDLSVSNMCILFTLPMLFKP